MNTLIFCILVFSISIYCNYRLKTSYNLLSVDQKGQYPEAFPSTQKFIAIFTVFCVTILVNYGIISSTLFYLFLLLVFLFVNWKKFSRYKRLKTLNFPASYLKSMLKCVAIIDVLYLILLVMFASKVFSSHPIN